MIFTVRNIHAKMIPKPANEHMLMYIPLGTRRNSSCTNLRSIGGPLPNKKVSNLNVIIFQKHFSLFYFHCDYIMPPIQEIFHELL